LTVSPKKGCAASSSRPPWSTTSKAGAEKPYEPNWNARQCETGIWTGKLQTSGLLWIKKHGKNSTQKDRSEVPQAGEVYLTALDPKLGNEIQKSRPALIIQNDVSNRLTHITIVAPITSTVRFPLNPVHVLLSADQSTGLSVVSVALLNQIRAVANPSPAILARIAAEGRRALLRANPVCS